MAKEAHVPKAGEQLSLAASTGSMQLIRIQEEFLFCSCLTGMREVPEPQLFKVLPLLFFPSLSGVCPWGESIKRWVDYKRYDHAQYGR